MGLSEKTPNVGLSAKLSVNLKMWPANVYTWSGARDATTSEKEPSVKKWISGLSASFLPWFKAGVSVFVSVFVFVFVFAAKLWPFRLLLALIQSCQLPQRNNNSKLPSTTEQQNPDACLPGSQVKKRIRTDKQILLTFGKVSRQEVDRFNRKVLDGRKVYSKFALLNVDTWKELFNLAISIFGLVKGKPEWRN